MSHITELLAEIKDLSILGRVAKKHGYNLTQEKSRIQGVGNQNVEATLNIKGSQGTAVGFRKQGSSYTMVADMYGVSNKDRTFIDKLTQEYAVEVTKMELMKKGYNVSQIKTLADGSIDILLENS